MGLTKAVNAAAETTPVETVIRTAMEEFARQSGLLGEFDNLRKAGFQVSFSDPDEKPGLMIEATKGLDPASMLVFRLVLTPQEDKGFHRPSIEYFRDDKKAAGTGLMESHRLSSALEIPEAVSMWVMQNLPRVTGAAYEIPLVRGADISPTEP